ncbi:sugar O-acetyltransferase [Candidatus Epulonipiscium viviparus]|uniref:sugar O-acetyltransferase n=1 Tax=Candidatus Epulonipiscium viviparus TaxID=420336 RepID=UPI00273809AA|nr:sugar O-acetyltransferase [Candidatus Epulopiscium viviparus]
MTEKEKAVAGLLYNANYDQELIDHRIVCKDLCHQLNVALPSDIEAQRELFPKIVGSVGKDFFVTTPFQCDYGYNIFIGDNFYSNHNLIILDCAKVTIGNHVFIAPNCCISAAGHPLDFENRNIGLEFAYPITIEDNVWIGANVTILPGVTIGKNSVIGAGSVVSRSIPADSIAVGVPCRRIKAVPTA